jgi:phenylacetate-CoA ligase
MIGPSLNPKAEKSRYWNPYFQTMPREKINDYHLKKLPLAIKYAYENSSLHRKLYDEAGIKPEDIKTFADYYYKVPITDKPHYIQEQIATGRPPGIVLPWEHIDQYVQTTGTTGVPLMEPFNLYGWLMISEFWCAMWWDMGIRPGDSAYFCFDFGLFGGFWAGYYGCKRMGVTVYSGGGKRTEDRIRDIMRFKPTIMLGTPTYLLYLAEMAKGMGLDVREAEVKYLTTAGEPGSLIPATRRALSEAWGVGDNIGDAYGISEVVGVGMECGVHPGGVHLVEPCLFFYAANPETWEPVKDGEVGELVVTSYSNTVTPFIKYRTHDLVEWHSTSDHGCGWTWAYLPGSVLGRTDFMVVVRGVNVYPTAVENLVGEVESLSTHLEMHVTREKEMDRMLVKVEAAEEMPAEKYGELANKLADTYYSRLGVRLETEVVAPNSLPRYEIKTKKIFDHRPKEVRR